MSESNFDKIKRGLATPINLPPIDEKLIEIGIVPKYSQITLFLVSIIFILFYLLNFDFREEFFDFFIKRANPGVIFIFTAIILSIYNTFKNRIISQIEKYLILFGIIFTNLFIALFAGLYVLEEAQGWLAIFPSLNMINAFLLLFLCRAGLMNEKSIGDEQAKKEEIVIGIFFVTLILLISQYVFNHYWAITFSICLLYATSLVDLSDKLIIKILLRKGHQR